MKKCPFCAEEIQEEAVKCRFCGEFLDDNYNKSPAQKPKWYTKMSSLLIGFFIIGPFIIPYLWLNPHYSNTKKTVLSLIIIVISIFIYQKLKATIGLMLDPVSYYYKMLNGG